MPAKKPDIVQFMKNTMPEQRTRYLPLEGQRNIRPQQHPPASLPPLASRKLNKLSSAGVSSSGLKSFFAKNNLSNPLQDQTHSELAANEHELNPKTMEQHQWAVKESHKSRAQLPPVTMEIQKQIRRKNSYNRYAPHEKQGIQKEPSDDHETVSSKVFNLQRKHKHKPVTIFTEGISSVSRKSEPSLAIERKQYLAQNMPDSIKVTKDKSKILINLANTDCDEMSQNVGDIRWQPIINVTTKNSSVLPILQSDIEKRHGKRATSNKMLSSHEISVGNNFFMQNIAHFSPATLAPAPSIARNVPGQDETQLKPLQDSVIFNKQIMKETSVSLGVETDTSLRHEMKNLEKYKPVVENMKNKRKTHRLNRIEIGDTLTASHAAKQKQKLRSLYPMYDWNSQKEEELRIYKLRLKESGGNAKHSATKETVKNNTKNEKVLLPSKKENSIDTFNLSISSESMDQNGNVKNLFEDHLNFLKASLNKPKQKDEISVKSKSDLSLPEAVHSTGNDTANEISGPSADESSPRLGIQPDMPSGKPPTIPGKLPKPDKHFKTDKRNTRKSVDRSSPPQQMKSNMDATTAPSRTEFTPIREISSVLTNMTPDIIMTPAPDPGYESGSEVARSRLGSYGMKSRASSHKRESSFLDVPESVDLDYEKMRPPNSRASNASNSCLSRTSNLSIKENIIGEEDNIIILHSSQLNVRPEQLSVDVEYTS